MDKMREDFEVLYPRPLSVVWNVDKRCYYTQSSGAKFKREMDIYNARWESWKASRESLVVELPHMADYVNMLGQVDKCYSYLDDLHAAIHAAGIRTK